MTIVSMVPVARHEIVFRMLRQGFSMMAEVCGTSIDLSKGARFAGCSRPEHTEDGHNLAEDGEPAL